MEIEIKENTLSNLTKIDSEIARLNNLKENIIISFLDALDVDIESKKITYDLEKRKINVD